MARVLIIDDDEGMSYTLKSLVRRMGHQVDSVLLLQEGLRQAAEIAFDVVFLDVRLPDGNGLEELPALKESRGKPEVIIITGTGDSDGAELAIQNGAWDYIEKPSSIQAMTLPLVRALQYREEKQSRVTSPVVLKRDKIIGDSPAIQNCLDLVAKAALGDANVLITGETGTGKELFARTIHENSPRKEGNFVVVDCASIPENLVASMLFGYEKGAFTGADRASSGLIRQASGGTLFLDEIGELPFSIQKAFLRITQERHFRPVGSKREVESNFRLVSATNRNLDEMVQAGLFREDLLYRIRTLEIHLPGLRNRQKDIKALCVSYMNTLCESHGIALKGFSPDFFQAIESFEWPGNVRELFNTLETSFLSAYADHTLFAKHLPVSIRVKVAQASLCSDSLVEKYFDDGLQSDAPPTLRDFRKQAVNRAEKQYLECLMKKTEFDIKEACRISGIERARMYNLLKKNNISKKK
ncbi:MAG: sigma-54 dependent transcriptional regulator [Desulfobulbaceae bacterium]|nr:sigma-54 dependent transcriptional regulator [Desulfobulbaceae bacterium]